MNAQLHADTAAGFTAIAEGVTNWDAPSPVEGWLARDVVRHLVEWLPGLLSAGAGLKWPDVPAADQDPMGAWRAHTVEVQRLLEEEPERPFSHEHIGELALGQAIDQFYTADVFMHTWDLARASGQAPNLDAERCAAMLEGMLPLDEMLRSSGQYGPAMPAPSDASAQDKLMAFVGRDIQWHPGPGNA